MSNNIGITIRKVGIGDGLQFSSLPENFFKKTGQKLIDVSKPWFFDHNPYVVRDVEPKKTIELWNYPRIYDWPRIRDSVYLSNAEIHCAVMGIRDPVLIHPRLYKFEDFPFYERKKILFHPFGKSHGNLSQEVISHVLTKYKGPDLFQVGVASDKDLGIQRINTPSLWELTKVISECRMFIGIDSGPAWIAACYPDVLVKKIRKKFQNPLYHPSQWIPLSIKNEHSFWDDTNLFKIYNCFEYDVGFTQSYLRI